MTMFSLAKKVRNYDEREAREERRGEETRRDETSGIFFYFILTSEIFEKHSTDN